MNLLSDIKSGKLDASDLEIYGEADDILIPNDSSEDSNVLEAFHPILTKPGYYTDPDISELQKFDYESLREVPDFRIYNDEGMIEFEEEVDLTFVNLDEIVEIGREIEIYPREEGKPREGQKINKPAVLTFHNCPALKKHKNLKKIEMKLIDLAEKQVAN